MDNQPQAFSFNNENVGFYGQQGTNENKAGNLFGMGGGMGFNTTTAGGNGMGAGGLFGQNQGFYGQGTQFNGQYN